MLLLTILVAIYAIFNEAFTSNEALNSTALFIILLYAFIAVTYKFRRTLFL